MNLAVVAEIRSVAFREWLRGRKHWCQRCGSVRASEFAHPPRRRPWIGMVNGTFSPSKAKASDLGGLHLCTYCHRQETEDPRGAWPDPRFRDRIALQNLLQYAETLDAGRDPEAEMMEHLQQLIVEMEGMT